MDVRTLYTRIKNGSELQIQEMQGIMESFLRQRSRSFSTMNQKEQAERLISENASICIPVRRWGSKCGSAISASSISALMPISVRSAFSTSASS